MESQDGNKPFIIKRRERSLGGTDPVELHIRRDKEERTFSSPEQTGLEKIVEDSGSNFYITGKNVKVSFLDFLNLLEKHDINEIEDLENEEVVMSTRLMTKMATADLLNEGEDQLKMIDATAVGLFLGTFLLSLFALFTQSLPDIKTFAWIILGVSAFFLATYLYKGLKTGSLKSLMKSWIRQATKLE